MHPPERLQLIMMLAPTMWSVHKLQITHRSFHADSAKQYMVRTRFRILVTSHDCLRYRHKLPNGRRDGPKLRFRDNGLCVSRTYYSNDQQHGACVSWLASGRMGEQCTYDHGRLHGEFKSWYISGQLYDHTVFVHDNFSLRATWYESGQPHKLRIYLDGRPHGEQLTWFESGTVKKQYTTVNGRRCGSYKSWYPGCTTGQMQEQCEYMNDELHGIQRTWHPNGQRKSIQRYHHSSRIGVSSIWNADGVLMQYTNWDV